MSSAELSDSAGLQTVKRFFHAQSLGDWQSMARCYHDQASFCDPLFPDLRSDRIVHRLYMLYSRESQQRIRDPQLDFKIIFADERKVQVEWVHEYQQGERTIKNQGLSTLALWDDLIVRHVDEFKFADWAKQSLGIRGLFLGRLESFQRRVQRSARVQLDEMAGTISK